MRLMSTTLKNNKLTLQRCLYPHFCKVIAKYLQLFAPKKKTEIIKCKIEKKKAPSDLDLTYKEVTCIHTNISISLSLPQVIHLNFMLTIYCVYQATFLDLLFKKTIHITKHVHPVTVKDMQYTNNTFVNGLISQFLLQNFMYKI